MFDWNDQELADIIWDEADVVNDHIVPYPKGSEERRPGLYGDHYKKEWDRADTNPKTAEQKKPVAKNNYSGGKEGSFLQFDSTKGISAAGHSMDPWTDLSLSHAPKPDQDSIGTEVSNNLTEISKLDSSRCDKTSRVDNGSEILQNQQEDREESDFVDYDWANIGSFDDLDRIFSNDDPIFGHASLGNADQPWSSSKDTTTTPEKSFPLSMDSISSELGSLRTKSKLFEVKTECEQDQDQSFTHCYGEMSYLTSHAPQNEHASADSVDYAGHKSKRTAKDKTDLEMLGKNLVFNSHLAFYSHLAAGNITTLNEFPDKVNSQKKIIKAQTKSEGGCEGQQLQDSYGTWSPREQKLQQFSQIVPSIPQACISSVLSQKTQLQGPVSSQYQHSSNSFVAPSDLYIFHPSNANPISMSSGTSMKPLTMTPQEKIEKLRRRQQMQALLAIQKQQQQFTNQVSSNNDSVVRNCLLENQMLLMEGGDIEVEENISTLPSVDPNSPIEQDDSNTISVAIDDYYSLEDMILHQLQDIIAKMDVRIRLCIRDSLFRLAQSATQRHSTSDTSCTNKNSRDDKVLMKEETSTHNRFTQMPDVEMETNSIDRTVAHLLFHRPLEFSGKHPNTPESPASTMLPCKRNTTGLLSSPRGFLPDSYKSEQNLSYYGSKNPHLFAEGEQSKNNRSLDTSKNASNNETADTGGVEIEASQ